jgi:8-oxo-dGTP diphosphatase
MDSSPEFGVRDPTLPVRPRPGVYALILDPDQRVLVMRTPKGYYLPGGGIDEGETHHEALAREVLEECGCGIEIGREVARASQYIRSDGSEVLRKDGTYYLATLGPRLQEPTEADHEPVWLSAAEAVAQLVHEAQSFSLRKAVGSES